MVQEALANVRKPARATAVTLTLSYMDRLVVRLMVGGRASSPMIANSFPPIFITRAPGPNG